MSDDDFEKIKDIASATKFGGVSWSTVLKDYGVTDRNKRLFMYGVALHTATDLFAHSTHGKNPDGKMEYISHDTDYNHNHIIDADDSEYKENRYVCAKNMAQAVIKRILGYTKGDVSDFAYALKSYDGTFKIPSYATKAKAINETYYINNQSTFDQIVN